MSAHDEVARTPYGPHNLEPLAEIMRRFAVIFHLSDAHEDSIKVKLQVQELIAVENDTTASLIVHTLYHLSRDPKLWSRLRNMVKGLNGRCPLEEDLKSLRLFDDVIKESECLSWGNILEIVGMRY